MVILHVGDAQRRGAGAVPDARASSSRPAQPVPSIPNPIVKPTKGQIRRLVAEITGVNRERPAPPVLGHHADQKMSRTSRLSPRASASGVRFCPSKIDTLRAESNPPVRLRSASCYVLGSGHPTLLRGGLDLPPRCRSSRSSTPTRKGFLRSGHVVDFRPIGRAAGNVDGPRWIDVRRPMTDAMRSRSPAVMRRSEQATRVHEEQRHPIRQPWRKEVHRHPREIRHAATARRGPESSSVPRPGERSRETARGLRAAPSAQRLDLPPRRVLGRP